MLKTLPPETSYPLCTVKEIPRQPEHCIQYAYVIEWPEHFQRGVDKDSPLDMQWICDHAQQRAAKFGIEGVNYKLTLGVIKNIIPAIASTNALVAAACVNECLKLLTGCNYRLKNVSYNYGQTRMNIQQHADMQEPDCLVCSKKSLKVFTVSKDQTLQQFIAHICDECKLSGPTLQHGNDVLCSRGFLGQNVKHKLELTWTQLKEQGYFDESWEISLLDNNVASELRIMIKIA